MASAVIRDPAANHGVHLHFKGCRGSKEGEGQGRRNAGLFRALPSRTSERSESKSCTSGSRSGAGAGGQGVRGARLPGSDHAEAASSPCANQSSQAPSSQQQTLVRISPRTPQVNVQPKLAYPVHVELVSCQTNPLQCSFQLFADSFSGLAETASL